MNQSMKRAKRMHRGANGLGAAIAALLCTACAHPEMQNFVMNGSQTTIDATPLRHDWTSVRREELASSAMSPDQQLWTLDFIALSHEHLPSPCTKLILVSIVRLPLEPVRFIDPADGSKPVTIRPAHYEESWHVQACRQKVEWRIVDNPDAAAQGALTPLLWSRTDGMW